MRTAIEDLVRDTVVRIAALDLERYALFGQSMGGLVAFETARELARRGVGEPQHLFISAARDPRTSLARHSLRGASDDEVDRELVSLGGTNPRILAEPTLREYAIAMLRADYEVLENYQYRGGEGLACPLTTFASEGDALISPTDMRAWEGLTAGRVDHAITSGDHFFVHSRAEDIIRVINSALAASELRGA